MLVYGTRLWFTREAGITEPLAVTSRWLSRKVKKQLAPGRFLEGVDRGFDGGHSITSIAAADQYPKVVAVAYRHPDRAVPGRQWTTEIGLRQEGEDEPVECTILLTTNEISTRVSAAVQVSRPGVVTEMVRSCSLSPKTQGVSVHTLDDEGADAFRHVVLDPKRTHSLIVLSPDLEGRYIADPNELSSMLLGLADIVVIPPSADTFWLARVVGREYIPYHGAAKLLYPPTRRVEGGPAPSRLMTRADADNLRSSGTDPKQELVSLVVHRSNLPLSWSHIGLQVAKEQRLGRLLAERRDALAQGGSLKEYNEFLEKYVLELEEDKKRLAASVESFERLISVQDDRERQLSFDNESLKQRLSESGRSVRQEEAGVERGAVADAVQHGIAEGPTPEEALRILEFLFADRVKILPSAWKAARDAGTFRHRQRLYALLHTLAAEYWESLAAGLPDSEARKVFGNAYAAQESETVASRGSAKARRTFEYEGRQVPMMKHLKIGVKDSATETIRVHFEWFADDQIIVIGHCGAHIPFK